MMLLVEGNIGVGKSTFLEIVREFGEVDGAPVNVIPEPVDEWEKIGILDAFYKDQKRWAYTFQSIAFATRISAVLNKRIPDAINIFERSVYIDRHGFAKCNKELGNMNELEWKAYIFWYDTMVKKFEQDLTPDRIIYLRASPETCYRRILKRSRDSESGVSMEYLSQLHEKYEEWSRMPEVRDRIEIIDLDSDYTDLADYKPFIKKILTAKKD